MYRENAGRRIDKLMITGLVLVAGVLFLAACGNMREQPKLAEPYAASPTFGVAAREILTQTVPVGQLREDELLYTGMIDGEPADVFPFEVTRAVLERGQEQFNSFCTPCHGYAGYGDGVISEEGFPKPASFHEPEIRAMPVGHYFDVITNGQNAMYSYAARVAPDDRWAITAYIRALQFSQNATVDALPPDVQDELQAAQQEAIEAKEAYSGNVSE